jgi:uroporphyrin-III C-methyltransferase
VKQAQLKSPALIVMGSVVSLHALLGNGKAIEELAMTE